MKKTSIREIVNFVKGTNEEDTMSELNIEEGEDKVIEADNVDVNKIKQYNISYTTPLTISSNIINGKNIATIFFLCKDEAQDFMYILYHNYIVEDDEDDATIRSNPLHDDENFISKMVAANMIAKHLPKYNTDLVFNKNEDRYAEDKEKFYLLGVPSNNNETICRFNMSSDVFASMSFTDSYLIEDYMNNHDFTQAILTGADKNNHGYISEIYMVDDVETIISLALADKKSGTLGCVFKVKRYIDDGVSDAFKILVPFVVEGSKFKKDKFNATMESIGDDYAKDADQYVCDFMWNTRIGNIDKEYLIIKGKNKDNLSKVFFLDTDLENKLSELVDKF